MRFGECADKLRSAGLGGARAARRVASRQHRKLGFRFDLLPRSCSMPTRSQCHMYSVIHGLPEGTSSSLEQCDHRRPQTLASLAIWAR